MKVKYTLEYNKEKKLWTIWKNVESYHAIGCKAVYSSESKKDCLERYEKLKNE